MSATADNVTAGQIIEGPIKAAVYGQEIKILTALGIDWNGKGRRHCPFDDHPDEHPSWRWDENEHAAFCTCDRGRFDIYNVISKKLGCNYPEALKFAAETIGRADLIGNGKQQTSRQPKQNYMTQSVENLLDPPAEYRDNLDDNIPRNYLAHRLGIKAGAIKMPTTKATGWVELFYSTETIKQTYPCAVFETVRTTGKGKRHAHRIFTAPGGHGKADIREKATGEAQDIKKSARGKAGGCAVIWGDIKTADHVIICEGIETGQAIVQSFDLDHNSAAVAACISAAGIETFKPPRNIKTVTVAADRDEGQGKSKAGEKAAVVFAERNHKKHDIRITLPGDEGCTCDWLDIYLESGADIVREGIEAAKPYQSDKHRQAAVDQVDQVIDEFNKIYAMTFYNGTATVLHERVDRETNQVKTELIRPQCIATYHKNEKIIADIKTGKTESAGKLWLEHPRQRKFKDVCFLPGVTDPPQSVYNLWRGWAVKPRKGCWDLYQTHLFENVCNEHENNFNYLIDWMADAVQNMKTKPGIAVVLRGKQGVGKNTATDIFGSLFGPHYLSISESEQLTNKHNGHLETAQLVVLDEAIWAGDRRAESKLKAMITADQIMIEHKFMKAGMRRNHMRVMMTSNADWVVPKSNEDRRFFVLDVGDAHRNDHAYFEAIHNEADNGGREALLHYLMNRDITEKNLRDMPATAAGTEQKIQSLDSVQHWYFEALNNGELAWFDEATRGTTKEIWPDDEQLEITKSTVMQSYREHAKRSGVRRPTDERQVGKQLLEMCDGNLGSGRRSDGGRPRYYLFPPLGEARQIFEDWLGTDEISNLFGEPEADS